MSSRRFSQSAINLVLLAFAFFTFLPVLILLVLSLKNLDQFNNQPLGLTFPLYFDNYSKAWNVMFDPIVHNVIVAVASTSLSLIMGASTAFVFARFTFPGRRLIFASLVFNLLVPSTILLVPTFQLVVQLNLHNTLWALILPYAAHQSLIILVLYSFFSDLPKEMFEAAHMDGAGVLDLFWRIAIPLALPAISAMAIYQVWWIWNDYAWPVLVANTPTTRTVSAGLIFFNDFTRPEPGAGMAAAVIAALPVAVLFLFTMRTFIAGMTSGSVKE
jgi:ABC-type glycerol-3-phosphate transport system permease component